MTYKRVKVRLKEGVTNSEFWRATYCSDSNLGIRLIPDLKNMKKEYLDGRLYKYGSLEVEVPVAYYSRETETVNDTVIEYGYIKEGKDIWEVVE